MTENEVKIIDDCLKELREHRSEYLKRSTPWRIINRAVRLIIELKEYKEIGTVEEFKALKEKKPKKKKSNKVIFTHDSYAYCPHCKNPVQLWNRICEKCCGELDWK